MLKTGSKLEIFLTLSIVVCFVLSMFFHEQFFWFIASIIWAGVVGLIFIIKDKI